MFALDAQTEHHLVVFSLLVWQLELLLLPPKLHPRKSDQLGEHLHLYHVVVRELEPQRLAVVILVMVRVAPPVTVQQVTPVPRVLVVVELELVLLAGPLEHHPQQHPGPHVEPGQLHEHLALGLTHLRQPRPVHLLVSSFDDPIADPEEVLAGVGP